MKYIEMKQLWLYDGLDAEIAYKEVSEDTGVIHYKKIGIKFDSTRNSSIEQGLDLLKNIVTKLEANNLIIVSSTYKVKHKKGYG